MTSTPETYKAVLLRTVSRGAAQSQPQESEPHAVSPALWLSVLLRMKLWVTLIFNRSGETDVLASLAPADDAAPLNRRAARRGKHTAPAAHQSYALGHILLRRYGFARFVQWLYRFGLMGRVRFCFVSKRSLLWATRKAVAHCEVRFLTSRILRRAAIAGLAHRKSLSPLSRALKVFSLSPDGQPQISHGTKTNMQIFAPFYSAISCNIDITKGSHSVLLLVFLILGLRVSSLPPTGDGAQYDPPLSFCDISRVGSLPPISQPCNFFP